MMWTRGRPRLGDDESKITGSIGGLVVVSELFHVGRMAGKCGQDLVLTGLNYLKCLDPSPGYMVI